MAWNAGATIEEDTGDTNMNSEFRMVMRQRFPSVQFFGLSGSSRPSQSTLSRSESLVSAGMIQRGILRDNTRSGSLPDSFPIVMLAVASGHKVGVVFMVSLKPAHQQPQTVSRRRSCVPS